MNNNYSGLSVSIEIGAHGVKVLAAEFDVDRNKLQFISMHEALYPTDKFDVVMRGEIHDSETVETALKNALDYLTAHDCDLSEAHYYFVVTGNTTHVSMKRFPHSFQETRRIEQLDLDHVKEELSHLQANPGTEIIYNSPRVWYIGESEKRIILGQNCRSFVQENLLVYADSQVTNNIYEMIAAITAHNPSFLTYSPIATATAVLDESARRKGSLVINIGDEVTEFCLFHNGICNYAETIIVGVKHIANDLSVGLGIEYNLAKEILIKFGNALVTAGSSEVQVEIDGQHFRKDKIQVIINLRLKELIAKVKTMLEGEKLLQKIGHAVYLTGGGAQITEIEFLVREVFQNTPVQQAKLELNSHQVEIIGEALNANTFSTVAGLAIMGHTGGDQDEDTPLQMLINGFKKVIDRFKQFFKGEK
ncbi:MAG: hypothetical protein KAG98_01345 [Lentisphaeria bacterium]|nr:hypothetical protein [Lentisphaeria bacterium]